MKKRVNYDDYYQSQDLFGEPYAALLAFFEGYPLRGTLLDVGCGQGRDALALAGMGFEVTGIDHSVVGIEQMLNKAQKVNRSLKGEVLDIYSYQAFDAYDFILLDSMFHFGKKERDKETEFLVRIMRTMRPNAIISICIADTGNKYEILTATIESVSSFEKIQEEGFEYQYIDQASSHTSTTPYKMLSLKKVGV